MKAFSINFLISGYMYWLMVDVHSIRFCTFFVHLCTFFAQAFLKENFHPLGCLYAAMLLLVTRPLPRDGGMAEDHGAPEAGQLSRVWTRGRRETEGRQRMSGAKSP